MSLTPAQLQSGLARLTAKSKAARDAQAKADTRLEERNTLAASLADKGVRYQDLANAIGITVDGVTYVLRRARSRK